ncbi:hypothetical protein [Clostridium intestinale]|nr:hypothetical protein [Clostridium intestinale]
MGNVLGENLLGFLIVFSPSFFLSLACICFIIASKLDDREVVS